LAKKLRIHAIIVSPRFLRPHHTAITDYEMNDRSCVPSRRSESIVVDNGLVMWSWIDVGEMLCLLIRRSGCSWR